MMPLSLLSYLLSTLLALPGAVAHPGHSLAEELQTRDVWLRTNPRSIGDCASQLQRRGHLDSAIARRGELLRSARVNAGIPEQQLHRRDFANYDFSHQSDFIGSDPKAVFADGSSCILTPEVNGLGHYVAGELMRANISEGQPGVPLILDVQIINVRTCQPLSGTQVEVYQANSTGIYSGVVASGNGDSNDQSNLHTTFGRGIQKTDADGAVQFYTLFPGHYFGVASHIHIMTHDNQPTAGAPDGKPFAQVTHNGRMFFDQSLISQVEATTPYNTNQQQLTMNADDVVLNQEADVTDPFVRYALVGDRVEDGVVAWITVGVDEDATHVLTG